MSSKDARQVFLQIGSMRYSALYDAWKFSTHEQAVFLLLQLCVVVVVVFFLFCLFGISWAKQVLVVCWLQLKARCFPKLKYGRKLMKYKKSLLFLCSLSRLFSFSLSSLLFIFVSFSSSHSKTFTRHLWMNVVLDCFVCFFFVFFGFFFLSIFFFLSRAQIIIALSTDLIKLCQPEPIITIETR